MYIHTYVHTYVYVLCVHIQLLSADVQGDSEKVDIHMGFELKQQKKSIVRIYVHTYIHTYIHACMHTYIHT